MYTNLHPDEQHIFDGAHLNGSNVRQRVQIRANLVHARVQYLDIRSPVGSHLKVRDIERDNKSAEGKDGTKANPPYITH